MNNSNPLVSAIVTTYNRKDLLSETLNSILNQTYTNFELIVVDNYSDYDFYSHIQSFHESRIKAYQNQNNGIIAINRNYGIKKAKGEYIAFCDDDDLWMPNKLERVIENINSNLDAILFCHNEIMIENGVEARILKYGPYNEKMYEKLLFDRNCISTSATTVKRNVLNEIDGFSERRDFISTEDYDLWLRLSQKGRFVFIDEVLGKYIINSDNISRSIISHLNASIAVKSKHLDYWSVANPGEEDRIKSAFSKMWVNVGINLLFNKTFNESKKYAIRSLKLTPFYWKAWIVLFLAFLRIRIKK